MQNELEGLYNMLTLEYDEEVAKRVEREEAREEGLNEGLSLGLRRGEEARKLLIINCLKKVKSCEAVAELLDIPLEEVRKIKDSM